MASPLATLITNRVSELGLNLHSLAARLGYVNTNKGFRRLHALMNGDIRGHRELLMGLAAGLEVSPEAVGEAVRATEAQNELVRHSAFVPHAIIVTERTIPSQITFCALTRGEAALRIKLDTARPRATYARQALAEVNRRTDGGRREIAFFGTVLGFVVNYDPGRAVRFDLGGRALQLQPRAACTGSSHWLPG